MKIKNIKLLTTENNYHRLCNLCCLKIVVQTDKALQIANTTGKRLWIPKSQMKILQAPFVNDLFVSDFIYKRHPEFFANFSS